MSAVKIMCGCAAVAGLVGQLAGMAPERRAAMWSGLNLVVGGSAPGSMPTAKPIAVAIPAGSALVAPASLPPTSLDTVVIPPDRHGQFQTTVEIEGQRLPVLVDTGATYVVLTFEDADRLGIRPMPSDFRYLSTTANGSVGNARTEIAEIRLGRISVSHVTAFVAPRGALWQTLLGMNFLSKLRGFRIEDGRLVLQP